MAEVLTPQQKVQTATAYAALILQDGKQPITGDNIVKVGKAAGLEISTQWAHLFEVALKGFDLADLLGRVAGGGGGGAPVAGGAVEASGVPSGGASKAEEKKEEKKEEKEEKEEEEQSIGGLFGSEEEN